VIDKDDKRTLELVRFKRKGLMSRLRKRENTNQI
jgi:hypothetical protein